MKHYSDETLVSETLFYIVERLLIFYRTLSGHSYSFHIFAKTFSMLKQDIDLMKLLYGSDRRGERIPHRKKTQFQSQSGDHNGGNSDTILQKKRRKIKSCKHRY